MLQILIRLRIVDEADLFTGDINYKDVSDLDELRSEVTDKIEHQFASDKYMRMETIWYVDESQKWFGKFK